MNIQKLIAITVAIAINCAVLAWFHAWSSTAAAHAAAASAHSQKIITLPVIDVHPSVEQLRQLRQTPAPAGPNQASVGGGEACLVMPYYSFAMQCSTAANS